MSDTEENLQSQVNNAVAGGSSESTDQVAENEQEIASGGESPEQDEHQEDSTASTDEGIVTGQQAATSTEEVAANDEEEDDAELDYVRPDGIADASILDEPFDINKIAADLPRDENGNVDPDALNKAVNDWYANRDKALSERSQREASATKILTQQWERVKSKFPEVWQNQDLIGLVRDMHLNSIDSANPGKYMSPMSAAKKIARMQKKAIQSGINQQRSHTRVEQVAQTEHPQGRQETETVTDYEKAQKMALSTDPRKAKEGRAQLMKLRYQARHK